MDEAFWVLAGAALTAIGGVIGVQIQAHREHRRWMRAERLKAYIEAHTIISEIDEITYQQREIAYKKRKLGHDDEATRGQVDQLEVRNDDLADRVRELTRKFHAANSPLVVLGPDRIRVAAKDLAASVDDDELREAAEIRFQEACASILKLTN